MTEDQKINFIENDLNYELRCLIGARAFWHSLKEFDAGFGVIIAMDSALVHTRNLFSFFTKNGKSDVSVVEYGGISNKYNSQISTLWLETINRYVMHISPGRLVDGSNIKDEGQLSEQIDMFTDEILRLWNLFENDSDTHKYRKYISGTRERAFKDLGNDQVGYLAVLEKNYKK